MTAGSFFAHLRSLGLLLIGYAEVVEDLRRTCGLVTCSGLIV